VTVTVALALLALLLAILAWVPPLRTYYLLNVAVAVLALAVVLMTGAIKLAS
jgi:hypothetical protein